MGYPSPAERYYLEQRQAAIDDTYAASVAAAIAATQAAQTSASAFTDTAGNQGMRYEQRIFDLGDGRLDEPQVLDQGDIPDEEWAYRTLGDGFGTAVSLVITIRLADLVIDQTSLDAAAAAYEHSHRKETHPDYYSAARFRAPYKAKLFVRLHTKVAGDDWLILAPSSGSDTLMLQRDAYVGMRIHGPFGDTIGLSLFASMHAGNWPGYPGQAEHYGLVITMGVQLA